MTDDNRTGRAKQEAPYYCTPNHIIETLLRRLQPTSFAVLAVLLRYRNERGVAYPSYDLIQELTGYARTTVSKALTELQAEGMIAGRKRGRGVSYSFPCMTSTDNGLNVQSIKHTSPEYGLVHNMDRTSTENGLVPVQKMDQIKTIDKDIPIKTKREIARKPLTEADFETFWAAYGRKGAKADAKRAWFTHTPGVALETVLGGVRVYLLTKRVMEGYKLDAVRFIARKVWENPTMGEEATGNAGKNGHYDGYKVPVGRKSRDTGKYADTEEVF